MNEIESGERKLKLFVVGESSGNPEEWLGIGTRAFVIAYDPKEAKEIADCGGSAHEILFERPIMITWECIPDNL